MRGVLAASGLLVVLAVLYWLAADAIPKSSLSGAVGADGFPKMLAVALALLSIALAGQTLAEMRKRGRSGSSAEDGKSTNWNSHFRAFGVVAIGAAFLIVLPVLGYAVSVAFLLVGLATYSGQKLSAGSIVFGVAGAAVFYVLFVHVLNVPLPGGIWTSLIS